MIFRNSATSLTNTTSASSYAYCRGELGREICGYDSNARYEKETSSKPGADALRKKDLPIFFANAEHESTDYNETGS